MSKKLIILLGGLMAMAFVLAACGDDEDKSGPANTPVPTSAPANTPVPTAMLPLQEGTLVVAVDENIGAAFGTNFNGSSEVSTWAMETLTRKNNQGDVIPGIAESWTVSADGTKITWKIRPNVPFHDHRGDWGNVTAADVKFSVENSYGDGSAHGRAGVLRRVENMVVVDDNTLEMTVPAGEHLNIISSLNITVIVGAKIMSEDYFNSVGADKAAIEWVGAGPFRHIETQVGDRILFEAVDDHYFKNAEFAKAEARIIPERATQLAGVRAGEVDLALLTPDFIPEVAEANVKIVRGNGGNMSYMRFHGNYLPERAGADPKDGFTKTSGEFKPENSAVVGDPDDPVSWENARKVREAMNLAIDRQAIIDTLYAGVAPLMTNPAWTPGSKWEDPSVQIPTFDPVRAKELMVEAGYADGFKGLLIYSMGGRAADDQASEAMAADWDKYLNITFDRQIYERGVHRAASVNRTLGTDRATLQFSAYGNNYFEPWFWLNSGTSWDTDSLLCCEHDFFEQTLADIRANIADDTLRLEKTRAAHKFMTENFLTIPLALIPIMFMSSDAIDNWDEYPVGASNFSYPEFIVKAN
jgi:peptide/nickel transport system substrate-binding protein